MPYTPPSQLSPAASKQNSPAPSRSHSYRQLLTPEAAISYNDNRQALPRSSSYLSKHRRSPSIAQTEEHTSSPLDQAVRNSEVNSAAYQDHGKIDPNGSLRQSPPPVTNLLIPAGATISPPESSHNSSDDEEVIRGRGRELDNDNLAKLQAAIRVIEQRKESSPTRKDEQIKKSRLALDLATTHSLISDKPPHPPPNSVDSSRPPLSREARKISHSRSSTDSNIVFDTSPHQPPSSDNSRHDTDEEDDSDSTSSRPPMVRKKSGELVRPALRPSSAKRRPSSMPGTPTYSKAVHFDSHLEHVRHFLQVDRPLAVSAGSSPVEAHESEVEFPFGHDEEKRARTPPYEWEIRLANFPEESDSRRSMPVRVERVFLSSDNKNLIGAIAVQNLAFQKLVVARYTLDYWKTTSEVVADYSNDVRRRYQNDGCDHFTFSIKLADQANLENKTMFFCIRYNVNGQVYWDSNNSTNYQVDFSKKAKPQHGKNGMPGLGARPLNALPRSRPSPPSGRPVSMPVSFDDFDAGFENFGSFSKHPVSIIGDTPLKLKSPRSRAELVPDAPTRRHKVKSQAFGNRYDFGASLSAAIQNASSILGDQSGFARSDTKQSSRDVPAATAKKAVSIAPTENGVKTPSAGQVSSALAAGPLASKPAALVSEKPSLQSQSYQELVDKYCFFGSAKTSPQLTKTALNMLDGANDDTSISDFSTGSARSSGSSTPTPPRGSSPSPPSETSPVKAFSPQISRSSSPLPRAGSGLAMRAASPVAFGYPYRQPSPSAFFADTPTSTAIHG